MRQADRVLDDEALVATVHAALRRRRPQSARRGRTGAPAEVVLRLLLLKHVRNWSYGVLEREVRTNLVYRTFTRVGGAKVPDAKTMGEWGPVVGPAVVAQLHARLVAIAHDARVVEGRRMRMNTTVVETNYVAAGLRLVQFGGDKPPDSHRRRRQVDRQDRGTHDWSPGRRDRQPVEAASGTVRCGAAPARCALALPGGDVGDQPHRRRRLQPGGGEPTATSLSTRTSTPADGSLVRPTVT